MAKRLYVGNMNYNTTEQTLRDFFAAVGEVVSANVVMDRMTGRSKGFGFVEMASDEAASQAISQLNGKELDGRTLNVAEARPPRQDGGGGRFGDRERRQRF